MKKLISVLLAAIMVFGLFVPVSAVELSTRSQYPIVYFRGNSKDIIDEGGNVIYDFDVEVYIDGTF